MDKLSFFEELTCSVQPLHCILDFSNTLLKLFNAHILDLHEALQFKQFRFNCMKLLFHTFILYKQVIFLALKSLLHRLKRLNLCGSSVNLASLFRTIIL